MQNIQELRIRIEALELLIRKYSEYLDAPTGTVSECYEVLNKKGKCEEMMKNLLDQLFDAVYSPDYSYTDAEEISAFDEDDSIRNNFSR